MLLIEFSKFRRLNYKREERSQFDQIISKKVYCQLCYTNHVPNDFHCCAHTQFCTCQRGLRGSSICHVLKQARRWLIRNDTTDNIQNLETLKCL